MGVEYIYIYIFFLQKNCSVKICVLQKMVCTKVKLCKFIYLFIGGSPLNFSAMRPITRGNNREKQDIERSSFN